MKWINNDTIAISCIGIAMILGILYQSNEAVSAAIGALAGYLGSKTPDVKG